MSTTRSRIALSALAAGLAVIALPGGAFAQDNGQHHGNGGNGGGHPAPQGGQPAGGAPQGGRPGGAPQGGWNGGNRGAPAGAPAMQAAPNRGPQGGWNGNGGAQARPDNGERMGQMNGGQRPGGFARPGAVLDNGRPGVNGSDHPGFDGGNRPGFNGGDRPGFNGGNRPGFDGNDHPGARPGGQWNGAPGRSGSYDPQPRGNYRAWSPQFRQSWRGDSRYDWRDWRDGHRDTFRIGRYYAPYGGAYYSRLSVGFVLDPAFYADSYWIYDPWTYHLPPAWAPYHWVRYYNDALLVDTYTGQVVDVLYDFFW